MEEKDNNGAGPHMDGKTIKEISAGVVLLLFLAIVIGFFIMIPKSSEVTTTGDGSEQEMLQEGIDYYQNGRHSRALKEFEAFSEKYPNNPEGYFWQGWAHYKLSQYNEATQYFEKSKDMGFSDTGVYEGLGNTYLRQGDYEKAIENYQKVREQGVEKPYVYQGLGWAHWELNHYNKSIKYFEEAIDLMPQPQFPVLDVVGWYNMENGNYDRALNLLNRSLETNPSNYVAISWKGFVFYKQENYNKAEELFNKSIEIFEKSKNSENSLYSKAYSKVPFSYAGKGFIFYKQGRYGDAQKMFNRSLSLDKNAYALGGKGLVHMEQNEFEKAEDYLSKATKMNSEITEFKEAYKEAKASTN